MALTIRNLSNEAEITLAKVQENNDSINTNSKAIEFVLENYLIKCNELENEKRTSLEFKNRLLKAEDKLHSIANGFGIITEMIAKSK